MPISRAIRLPGLSPLNRDRLAATARIDRACRGRSPWGGPLRPALPGTADRPAIIRATADAFAAATAAATALGDAIRDLAQAAA